jgi:hypothetical protein
MRVRATILAGAITALTIAPAIIAPAPLRAASQNEALCLMLEAAAREHGLPLDFFARLIWQESRFDAAAVGPVTRSGHRAQGIAQFMPGTAAERELLDPFDPVQALPKSAEFLRELREQFGNLGLAAAAYNAGPRRVREWLDGSGFMPAETRAYVLSITGRSVDEWVGARDGAASKPPTSCNALMASIVRTPGGFIAALEQRVSNTILRPWGVQLAAGFSRDRVLSAFSRIAHQFTSTLGGHDPAIVRSTLRTRGTKPFYQVRVGADSRGEADALCGRIRKAGGACMVLRNTGKQG